MESLAQNFNIFMNENLGFLDEPVMASALKLALVLYAGMAAPQLPYWVLDMFDYVLFRIAVLFLVVWTSNKDPTVALLLAIGLIVTMNSLAGRRPFETFLVQQNTNVMPACLGVTMADLLEVFNGDEQSLRQALFNVGVPANVKLTDNDAPILATHLVNFGYQINSACSPPNGNTYF